MNLIGLISPNLTEDTLVDVYKMLRELDSGDASGPELGTLMPNVTLCRPEDSLPITRFASRLCYEISAATRICCR